MQRLPTAKGPLPDVLARSDATFFSTGNSSQGPWGCCCMCAAHTHMHAHTRSRHRWTSRDPKKTTKKKILLTPQSEASLSQWCWCDKKKGPKQQSRVLPIILTFVHLLLSSLCGESCNTALTSLDVRAQQDETVTLSWTLCVYNIVTDDRGHSGEAVRPPQQEGCGLSKLSLCIVFHNGFCAVVLASSNGTKRRMRGDLRN